jgi:hypothetical protein
VRQNSRVYIHQRSGSANPRFLSPLPSFSSVGQQSHRLYRIRNHFCRAASIYQVFNLRDPIFNFRPSTSDWTYVYTFTITQRIGLCSHKFQSIGSHTFSNHHTALKYLYTGTVSESLFGQTSRHFVTYKRASFDIISIHRASSLSTKIDTLPLRHCL